ncbi:hypothetical protein M409DRAFT_30958 [Zasmidium cellare ATCC 36951]|uniref:F-box domain-containing protein n=1 Tax=Zasmidium cellare ATCC 36951 TaxID=1080233 RepID=A0A6A6BUT7_ZASCE|nr:uncharacterized protein M409DRAFT_30958 [Zasmidium cellare ATCC 36951]KAF2158554.1 hypothetical protein M409DRAFT_30958 [Zasmidium cellare ATCC 36951]
MSMIKPKTPTDQFSRGDVGTKLFGIGELRDLILAELPPKDLLRMQRVSQEWSETIKQFGRCLFLSSIQPSKSHWIANTTGSSIPGQNNITSFDWSSGSQVDAADLSFIMLEHLKKKGDSVVRFPAVLNTMVVRNETTIAEHDSIFHRAGPSKLVLSFILDPEHAWLESKGIRPSFIDMFISQPAIVKTEVHWALKSSPPRWITDVVRRKDGIRVIDILECSRSHNCTIDWPRTELWVAGYVAVSWEEYTMGIEGAVWRCEDGTVS